MMRRNNNNNRGNMKDIDMELAMIKRRRQMIQEQRQMLEECDQLERLQHEQSNGQSNHGQAGNWQQDMRYNNIQQPFNQFHDGNAFNQYPSAYENNSNGYQRTDNYQNKVWQHNAVPKPQMYGNDSFGERNYGMNGQQSMLVSGNVFNRNANRAPGPQRQQPRFANASKPTGVKAKTQFSQGKVMKAKVVANPLNKSKFPKKLGPAGPGYAGPVWESQVGVRRPRQMAPIVQDNTYLVTKATPNSKLHGRLELCLGEILREVKESVQASKLDIKLTVPLIKTLKEFIRNRIRKTMVGKYAHTVSYVLNVYRNRHPRNKDVMFVKNLKDMGQKEAKVGVDTASSPASKSLNKDSVKQKPAGAAAKTDDNAESGQPDEEEKEWLFQKMNVQAVTAAKLNELLLKLNELQKAEPKEEQADGDTEDMQTGEEEKKTEGEGKDATKEGGEDATQEGMEVEKKEEETPAPKDEKMDRLERFIEMKLPYILPRFKGVILAILNNEPVPKLSNHTYNYSQLYMVKLFGRPTLPKRHLLANFLTPYNVLNIRKLKTKGNLLVVGCGTEEDRNRLLAASGSTIDNIKLHMKAFVYARNSSAPVETKGDVAAAATDEENKDATVVEETAAEPNDTVDLCEENDAQDDAQDDVGQDDAQDDAGQDEEGDEVQEVQNGQDDEVIDLDAQDNEEGEGDAAPEAKKAGDAVQGIKSEAGTPSKPIMTRRSSRLPK